MLQTSNPDMRLVVLGGTICFYLAACVKGDDTVNAATRPSPPPSLPTKPALVLAVAEENGRPHAGLSFAGYSRAGEQSLLITLTLLLPESKPGDDFTMDVDCGALPQAAESIRSSLLLPKTLNTGGRRYPIQFKLDGLRREEMAKVLFDEKNPLTIRCIRRFRERREIDLEVNVPLLQLREAWQNVVGDPVKAGARRELLGELVVRVVGSGKVGRIRDGTTEVASIGHLDVLELLLSELESASLEGSLSFADAERLIVTRHPRKSFTYTSPVELQGNFQIGRFFADHPDLVKNLDDEKSGLEVLRGRNRDPGERQ